MPAKQGNVSRAEGRAEGGAEGVRADTRTDEELLKSMSKLQALSLGPLTIDTAEQLLKDLREACNRIKEDGGKEAVDVAMLDLVNKWDPKEDYCFIHVTKADAVRTGIEQELGFEIEGGGLVHSIHKDSLSAYTSIALDQTLVRKSVVRVKWAMQIGDLRKKVWTVMLHIPGKTPDRILNRYAPELVLPDKLCIHFFSSKQARSLDPFAEEVD